MKLRAQLAVVSLLLLGLPWAGCQYLREMESTLLQGQGMATQATSSAVAAALAERAELIYPTAERRERSPGAEWYLPAARLPLFADGYDDDWRDQPGLAANAGTPPELSLYAATWRSGIFLLLKVTDPELRYRRPDQGGLRRGDRLELRCIDERGILSRYEVAGEGPGAVRGRRSDSRGGASGGIRGALRETAGGYTAELTLPLDSNCRQLTLRVIDAGDSGERLLFDSSALWGGRSPWLVYPSNDLTQWLAPFAAPGREIEVRDRSGWTIGLQLSRGAVAAREEEVFWLLRLLYRAALGNSQPEPITAGDWILRELDSDSESSNVGDALSAKRVLEATSAIQRDGQRIGEVRVSETTERYLALTDRATSRVLSSVLLVLGAALLGLLGYASLLSWRIRRLSLAARGVVAADPGTIALPEQRAGDELGELSRSYSELLGQISEYNRYLKGLAGTLSHELRTPIAIVRSSLEQQRNPQLSEEEREVYRERASAGLDRLSRIVTAMSEASNIEDGVRNAAMRPLELRAFVGELLQVYAASHATHRFPAPVGGGDIVVNGNGELLAQALDKLVDNAVSFAPEGTAIVLAVQSGAGRASISVSNSGPLLPDTLRERLFEPMVSQREKKSGAATHLGLGLAIARAIADVHQGRLEASNRPDGSGVVVTLSLPLPAAPRRTASQQG